MLLRYFLPILFVFAFSQLNAQQKGDPNFNISLLKKTYEGKEGPVVYIDEAHNNFNTVDGRYHPFSKVLVADGYEVTGFKDTFSDKSLSKAEILVIANAQHESNLDKWELPTPSAFTKDEIKAVKLWVEKGGSLFLLADHMPFPGAAHDLASAFSVMFFNGVAAKDKVNMGAIDFTSYEGIGVHPITEGRDGSELVDTVKTFTGSAFAIPSTAAPLIYFPEGYQLYQTKEAWNLKGIDGMSLNGFCQGAAMEFGKGKVVIFGETGMFSAQLAENNNSPIGMNTPGAHQNAQLLLNIIHWLDGLY